MSASDLAARLLAKNGMTILLAEARLIYVDDNRVGDLALQDEIVEVFFLVESAYKGCSTGDVLRVRLTSDMLESEYLLSESRWNTRDRVHKRIRQEIGHLSDAISRLPKRAGNTELLEKLEKKRNDLYDRRQDIPQYAGGPVHGRTLYELGAVIKKGDTYLLSFLFQDVVGDGSTSKFYKMSNMAHNNVYWGEDKIQLIRAIEQAQQAEAHD